MRQSSVISIVSIFGMIIAFAIYLANATPVSAQCRVVIVAGKRTLVCDSPGGGPGPERPGLTMSEGPLQPLIPASVPSSSSSSASSSSAASSSSSSSSISSTKLVINTPTPTATPLPTATPFPILVSLNEILPTARNVDWNADSFTNSNDDWIELYNGGPRSANISGWSIDTGEKTPSYTILPGTSISSLGYVVLFRRETKLELDSAHQVRLLYPSGTVADSVRYPSIGDDQVYARLKDGVGDWSTDCVSSPFAKNCTVPATATTGFGLGYFRQHIAGIDRPFPADVVATNVFLAVLLALAMGFFGNLLNDVLESNESQITLWLAPLVATMQGLRTLLGRFDRWMEKTKTAGIIFLFKLAVVLLLYGALLAYLDPSYEFINRDGVLLIVALALSTGLVSLIDDWVILLFLKRRGVHSTVRLHSGNFMLVFVSTLFSRWSGLVPGLLVGSPAGLEEVSDEKAVTPQTSLVAIVLIAFTAVIAWVLAPWVVDDVWLNTLLLLIFAAGIQTAFFEMLPLSFLHGRKIYEVNRVVWVIMFATLGAIFLQTMLNPSGAFVNAFQSPNMILLSLIVALFCIASTAIWFYFKRSEHKTA